MPRKSRFFLPGIPVHIVQRGNNRQPVFFDDNDYRVYLDWLAEAVGQGECAIHAYVLMTNHIHLLITPTERAAISTALQALGRRFVPYINQRYGRTGTLWEGRFKANLVQDEGYLLACYRYIELNPVRARMVQHPEDYPWSSYHANALGRHDPLLSPHALYLRLADDALERQSAYRDLLAAEIDPEILRDVRACLQSGTPLGNDRFRSQIEQALGVNVGQSTRGRPRKPAEEMNESAEQLDLGF